MNISKTIGLILVLINSIYQLHAGENAGHTDSAKIYHHFVGIQFNNTFTDIDDFIYRDNTFKRKAFALRYGYKMKPFFDFGSEITWYSFNYSFKGSTVTNSLQTNFGVFARLSVYNNKRISPFIDGSAHLSRFKTISYITNNDTTITYNEFGFYFAPGVRVNFLKNRVSLDIMYKFSNQAFLTSKNRIVSFKINYHFN